MCVDRAKKMDIVSRLNEMLLAEMPQYRRQAAGFDGSYEEQRRLLRSLMNVRPPMAAEAEFLHLQDQLLTAESGERGIVRAADLPAVVGNNRLALWQGDITRLAVDAIVNAANNKMLGCFVPCHNCIDNVIHSAAGVQLRLDCAEIMERQGFDEPTGCAKITPGYNLPCRHVIHTVGPIVAGKLTDEHCRLLADCYRSCLELAAAEGLKTIAFCCISTGVFCFPNRRAAEIAIQTVTEFLAADTVIDKVIFNVFKEQDLRIYQNLLK